MKRLRLLLFATALGAGIGAVVFETRLVFAQRGQIQRLTPQVADSTQQLAVLRRQRDGTARDLALAEQQLARLPSVGVALAGPATDAPGPVAGAWLARTRQLRALAAENPSQIIPETALLTDEDWMRVAQHTAFETDAQCREALAALRNAAKGKFIPHLASAARKWTLAEGLDKVPGNLRELARYLEPPADPAILQRYEIVAGPASPPSRPSWQAREIVAIDEDLDSRYSVEANGSYGTSGAGPLTWNADYSSRMQSAYKAYRAANRDAQPPGLAQIIPYIDPPLPSATLEKLLEIERARQR